MRRSHILIRFTATLLYPSLALDNGLALTPPMGVNTWNSFRCDNVTAVNIKAFADVMVSNGLKDAGYQYVNMDDCWSTGRDPHTGELIADPSAFPLGMNELSDYVHKKGLLLGIYGDRGVKTCAGRPGSLDFEEQDAKTYAAWEIDYLKEDSCFAKFDHDSAFREYRKMRNALNATGRHIYLSLCGWNEWYAEAGKDIGNSWRIAADSDDWPHVYIAARTNERLAQYATPGGWNDPDMLIGSVQSNAIYITPRQQRTQFSLWSIMSAPLLIGSDLQTLSKHDLDTLTNMKVIGVNQDVKASAQGAPVFSNCPVFKAKEQNLFKPWYYPISKAYEIVLGLAIAALATGLCFVGSLACACTCRQHKNMGVGCAICGCILMVACATLAIYMRINIPTVDDCQQTWVKRLSSNGATDVAVLLVNWGTSAKTVDWCNASCLANLGFPNGACAENLWFDYEPESGQSSRWLRSISGIVPGDGGSIFYRLSSSQASCTNTSSAQQTSLMM